MSCHYASCVMVEIRPKGSLKSCVVAELEREGQEMFGSDWDPDDLYSDVHVPAVVDGLRAGESLEERNARLLAWSAEARESARPEGTVSDPPPDGLLRTPRPTDRVRGSAVRIVDPEGNESWRDIGTDTAALVLFVQAHGEDRGLSLRELRKPFAAGRPKARERFRRMVLSEIVIAAKSAGAKTGAIEHVLGLDRRRISELVGSD